MMTAVPGKESFLDVAAGVAPITFGPHGQAEDFKAGAAQFLEKCAHGSTGR
jgi:hypothetical protein